MKQQVQNLLSYLENESIDHCKLSVLCKPKCGKTTKDIKIISNKVDQVKKVQIKEPNTPDEPNIPDSKPIRTGNVSRVVKPLKLIKNETNPVWL
jgi:hypothetical protein